MQNLCQCYLIVGSISWMVPRDLRVFLSWSFRFVSFISLHFPLYWVNIVDMQVPGQIIKVYSAGTHTKYPQPEKSRERERKKASSRNIHRHNIITAINMEKYAGIVIVWFFSLTAYCTPRNGRNGTYCFANLRCHLDVIQTIYVSYVQCWNLVHSNGIDDEKHLFPYANKTTFFFLDFIHTLKKKKRRRWKYAELKCGNNLESEWNVLNNPEKEKKRKNLYQLNVIVSFLRNFFFRSNLNSIKCKRYANAHSRGNCMQTQSPHPKITSQLSSSSTSSQASCTYTPKSFHDLST